MNESKAMEKFFNRIKDMDVDFRITQLSEIQEAAKELVEGSFSEAGYTEDEKESSGSKQAGNNNNQSIVEMARSKRIIK